MPSTDTYTSSPHAVRRRIGSLCSGPTDADRAAMIATLSDELLGTTPPGTMLYMLSTMTTETRNQIQKVVRLGKKLPPEDQIRLAQTAAPPLRAALTHSMGPIR